MCRGSAQGDGSFRRHILVPTKRWPTSCRPPCGLIRHPAPLRRGPFEERALLRARTTATTTSRAPASAPASASASASASAERSESSARERMDALPAKGPLRSGGRWRSTRRAACTMHAVFRRCMDAPPKNSVTARGPAAQDARRALRRGVVSLGHVSLDTAKKGGSSAFSDRKLSILHRSTTSEKAHRYSAIQPAFPDHEIMQICPEFTKTRSKKAGSRRTRLSRTPHEDIDPAQ
jgi:hypothetical protein